MVDDLIREWGKWAYQDRGVRLNYGRNILDDSPGSSNALIDESLALLIDQAISTLKLSDPEGSKAVAYFGLGAPIARIADELGVSRLKAREAINRGKGYVGGYIAASYVIDGQTQK